MTSVQSHGCRHVGGRERLVGLLLEALGPQVQERVEGGSLRRRWRFDPGHRGHGILVGVRGEEGLGGVAVGQGGQREECYRGRRVHAGQPRVVMSGERQGEVSAGRRGAAPEAARPLEQTLLLLPLLFSEILLILKNLAVTSEQMNVLSVSSPGKIKSTPD